jgi:hypothetical protein
MQKYILDYLKNNIKSITTNCSLPQKKAVKTIVKGLFQKGRGILRELGNTGTQIPKTVAQKLSHHIGNIEMLEPVEDFADRRIISFIDKNSVIAYDLTDIAKHSAKKIERITTVFDGSRRKKTKGFFVHGVGVGKFLWRLRLHDNTCDFLPNIRKSILKKLITLTKEKMPIFAFDRGNDDKQLFEYLDDNNARFIVRIKSNRKFILKETGECLSVRDIPQGRHSVLLKEGNTQKKTPKYREYELIVHKQKKTRTTPIWLLISKNLDPRKCLSNKKITKKYLQRWGVENSFKQIKTSLNLEEIRVMKYGKFQNFVSLMHFCSLLNELLLCKIQNNLQALSQLSLITMFLEYKKFIKRYYLDINSHSFCSFLKHFFSQIRIYRKRPKKRLQISLFTLLSGKT